MLNLFEYYHQESKDLRHSLLASGYDHPTVVIHDDGFLPEGIVSPYSYFMGEESGKPCYFNQITVPKYWEIAGNGNAAEVFDKGQKRAEIIYAEPKQNRLVREVKWFDLENRIRFIDHYNKYGRRFAQTVYSLQNNPVFTSYFTVQGQEVIVENYVTNDIILNLDQKIKIFHSKASFVSFYLTYAGYHLDRILYNSLSLPFIVSYQLQVEGSDILFWQEKERQDIPGNMQLILDGKAHRTKNIIVQNEVAFDKMMTLIADEKKSIVQHLGYIYPFKQDNSFSKDCFILTNSDQLEQIDYLIEQLPHITFHIGALTEMSQRLTEQEQWANVRLYPQISLGKIKDLLSKSSIYLDINHQGEVLSVVRQAFEHNLLILAFDTTAHDRVVTNSNFIYQVDQVQVLRQTIEMASQSPEEMNRLLDEQRLAANYSSVEHYRQAIG